jgi:hypothetical protein
VRAKIGNKEIGTHMGLDYTSVSRIRAGERYPSMAVMMKVEMWLEWSLADQAVARFCDIPEYSYATKLEKLLVDKYGAAEEETDE